MSKTAPKEVGPIFSFVPKPYPQESIGSWVIRLCGTYQCTFKELQELMGIQVFYNDWDARFLDEEQEKLFRQTGISKSDFQYRYVDREFLKQASFSPIKRTSAAKPNYAWCPDCFDEDDEPYLRWHWRYKNFTHCLKHRTFLHVRCDRCDTSYLTDRAFLVTSGYRDRIEHMAVCQKCHAPLGRKAGRHYYGLLGNEVSFSQCWPDEVFGETLDIDAKPLRYPFDYSVNLYRLFPLEKASKRRAIGSPWSATLTPAGRSMMARTLMTVRREMRQEKIARISKVFADMVKGSK